MLPIPSLLPEAQKQFFLQSSRVLPKGHGASASQQGLDDGQAVVGAVGAGAAGALLAVAIWGFAAAWSRSAKGRVTLRSANVQSKVVVEPNGNA